jgi:putative SOS response-associated peptidase YedK
MAVKFKQPYYFSLKSEEPMALAGLWESWKTPYGNTLRTVCIITTSANQLMEPVHNRMPVLISAENFGPWLNPAIEGSAVQDLLMPSIPEGMDSWPVSKEVSRTSSEGEGLIQKIEVE